MFKKILFAYDGSENSKRSIDYLKDISIKFDAEVIVLTIYDVPLLVPDIQSYAYVDLETEVEEFSQITSREIIKNLDDECIKVKSIITRGQAGKVIIEFVHNKECDLIIMGSRGLGGLKNILLGSVSNYVLHNSHIPILIIK